MHTYCNTEEVITFICSFQFFKEYPISDLKKKSDDLVKYLWSRHVPVENDIILQQAKHLELQFIKEGMDRSSIGVFFIVLCLVKLFIFSFTLNNVLII